MRRAIAIAISAALAAGSAFAASPQPRAVAGAGWTSVPVAGDSGKANYERYCTACHGAGPDHPGTQALAAKYKGAEPAELERRTDLSAAFVIYTVRHGVSVMPAARKTEIGDADLKSIAAYLSRGKE